MSNVMDNTKLEHLNKLSASQVCLLMLRTLNTSDMSFLYMCFKQATVEDIIEEVTGILQIDVLEGCDQMTLEEHKEFWEYIENMKSYKPEGDI